MMTVGLPRAPYSIIKRIRQAVHDFEQVSDLAPNEIWLGHSELTEIVEYYNRFMPPEHQIPKDRHPSHKLCFILGRLILCRAGVEQELCVRHNPYYDRAYRAIKEHQAKQVVNYLERKINESIPSKDK